MVDYEDTIVIVRANESKSIVINAEIINDVLVLQYSLVLMPSCIHDVKVGTCAGVCMSAERR